MSVYDKYEVVIGLEVHAQLSTKTKAYAADANSFGDRPNTHVSPITLGHPGTLPKLNEKTFDYAILLGLAVGANITKENQYARKNYFYADLPKGYQITQDKTPICTGGNIIIFPNTDKQKEIAITRIHLEEDAGKSIHDQDPFNTLIDLNRAGVPLVEIVSEPDMRSSDEAYAYLTEVRKLVRHLEICDGNMEEGSLRCDANVSVMLKGSKVFGQRAEVKNMNSIRNVKRAIDFEVKRQIDFVESGGVVEMETRSYDAVNNSTFTLRSKEEAHDYRYFPEPDILPVIITQDIIADINKKLPALPNELFLKYTKEFGLSNYDANILTTDKHLANYFEEIIAHTTNYKTAVNYLNGVIKSYINDKALSITEFEIPGKRIADLIRLIDEGKISNSVAEQKVFPVMLDSTDSPLDIATSNNWIQDSNEDALAMLINQVLENYPEKVAAYKGGKKGLLGLFMGEVMKLSKGAADPKLTNQLLREKLEG